jgi:hypothetical protein
MIAISFYTLSGGCMAAARSPTKNSSAQSQTPPRSVKMSNPGAFRELTFESTTRAARNYFEMAQRPAWLVEPALSRLVLD